MSSFDRFIDRVLSHEGGYVNHPSDPGGETQWGISKRSYPDLDIKALTREDAKAIYRRDFWEAAHCDEMPAWMAFQVLDFAVNSGVGTALRAAQRALGVADDGLWGPVTRAAARNATPAAAARLLAERLEFMRRLSVWPAFGKGWAGRIAQNLRLLAADAEVHA